MAPGRRSYCTTLSAQNSFSTWSPTSPWLHLSPACSSFPQIQGRVHSLHRQLRRWSARKFLCVQKTPAQSLSLTSGSECGSRALPADLAGISCSKPLSPTSLQPITLQARVTKRALNFFFPQQGRELTFCWLCELARF